MTAPRTGVRRTGRALAWALVAALAAAPAAATVGGINAGRGSGGVSGSGPGVSGGPVVTPDPGAAPAAAATAVSGTVRRADGTPAKDVMVQFVRAVPGGASKVRREARTDRATGAYTVALEDGTWLGSACDSSLGYLPALWRITVADGEVVDFEEVRRAAPRIAGAEVTLGSDRGVIRRGDPVTLTGEGFRCSGRVRVEADGMNPYTQTAFQTWADGRVTFPFPALEPATAGTQVIMRSARFTYLQGPNRSNTATYRSPVTAVDIQSLPAPSMGPQGGSTGRNPPSLGAGGNRKSSGTKKRTRW